MPCAPCDFLLDVQDCGEYTGIANPGMSVVNWPFTSVSGVSMKTKQIDVVTNTKTKDNVMTHMGNVHNLPICM